jgi:O-antigen/teichoic acid export membrane protein
MSAAAELTSIARGGALNIAGTIANAVFGFALGVVITRGLGSDGAGVFFEAIALFTILTTVGQLGADVGVVRWIPRYLADGRRQDVRSCLRAAISPVVLASGILGALLFVFAPDISDLIVRGENPDAATPYLRVLGPSLPLATVSKVLLSAMRGFGTMVPFVAIEYFFKSALRPLLALVVLAAGLGTVAVAFAWAVPVAAGFVAALAWAAAILRRERAAASRRSKERLGAAKGASRPVAGARAVAVEFWRFTGYRALAAAFGVAILWLDVLLVGMLASSREAGVYAAASRLVTAGLFALTAAFLVMGPQISALLARGERERAQAVYQTSTCWLAAISFPIYITLALFAPLLLRVFGDDFTSGDSALVILSLAMLLNMGTGTVGVVLLMAGKSSWNLANTAAALVMNVCLNFMLIPRFGIVGAAAAWAVSIAIQNLAPLAEVWRALGLHPFSRGYLFVALAAALCFGGIGLFVRGVIGTSISSFVLFGISATLAYCAALWRLRDEVGLQTVREALGLRMGRPRTPAQGLGVQRL